MKKTVYGEKKNGFIKVMFTCHKHEKKLQNKRKKLSVPDVKFEIRENECL